MGWGHLLAGAFGLLLLSPFVWLTLWTCRWEGIECDFTNKGQVWDLLLRFLGSVVPIETMYLVLVSVRE
jgi:membrane protease YdiL (CAAX protease family)